MSWLQVVVLAIVQGLTEFLPVSSSAHLLIPSHITDWPDQGLAFDVAVHLGTLFAVLIYFRKDVIELLQHWFKSGFSQQQTAQSRLAWLIIVATFPVLIVGYLANDFIEAHLRNAFVMGTTTLVFALVLAYADKYYCRNSARSLKTSSEISFKAAVLIGLSQVVALIPGTSRSGITTSTALFMGLDRTQASRFSFLLSIPVITVAAVYYGFKLSTSPLEVEWAHFAVGIVLSALMAYVCIHVFLDWIQRIGFMPFVWYRIAFALFLFWVAFKHSM